MAEFTSSSTTTSSPKKKKNNKLCQECQVQEFCYQCPRCSFRSCSLTCCRAHKERLACNGKRDRTTFCRLSQMTDQTITSDYHFLEDVLRNVDTGKRILKQTRAGGGFFDAANNKKHASKRPRRNDLDDHDNNSAMDETPMHPLLNASNINSNNLQCTTTTTTTTAARHNPNWSHVAPRWRHVAKQALEHGKTQILFMPTGMQRRLQNQTHFKKDVLYWTVEWIIHSEAAAAAATTTTAASGDKDSSDKCSTPPPPPRVIRVTICESAPLQQAWQQQVMPQLLETKNYLTTAKFLLKQIPRQTYTVVSSSTTLQEALANRTVIEFPTIEVVPAGRLKDFCVALQEVQDAEHVEMEAIPTTTDDPAATGGN